LVALDIDLAGLPVQVWRQRHLAVIIEERHEVDREAQVEQLTVPTGYRRLTGAIQQETPARLRRFARPHVCQRTAPSGNALDEYLRTAARSLVGPETCLDDPCVIEYQQVAGTEQLRQLGKLPVLNIIPYGEQATVATRRGRVLRDQFVGQLVVEIRNQHGRAW